MAYGFPWTNLHELNLDWIIRKIQELEQRDPVPGYNVLAYGLVNDGITDNSDALDAMIAEIGSPNTIYFPSGNYLFSRRIEADDMSFIGDGKQVTFLHFANGVDGLRLNMGFIAGSNNSACITISDMSIMQSGRGGKAIYIRTSANGDRATQAPVIRDIKFDSSDGQKFNHGWKAGIELVNCNGAVIDRCSITGNITSAEPNYWSDDAIRITSDNSPLGTDYKITNCMFYYWKAALNAVWFEGMNFINNTVVGCRTGVLAGPYNDSPMHPLLIIDNCHINTSYMGVRCEKVKEIMLANTSLYQQLDEGLPNNFGFFGLDCNTIQIHDCQMLNLSTNNHFAVQLENCDTADIHDIIALNKSSGTQTYAINLINCTDCLVHHNMSDGTINDTLGTNTVQDNITL